MDFATDKPIYRQIVDYCHARILAREWPAGERIPSVRELAVTLQVNTHTVLKALETLQAEEIIAPRRGMGYFLAPDAPKKTARARRQEFFINTLPALRRQMEMLGITPEELLERLTAPDGD